ncbi:hypothetical protein ACQRIU_005586 [Beauveria bassiana]
MATSAKATTMMDYPARSVFRGEILLKRAVVPLLQSTRTYVPDNFLKDLKITPKSLDLKTGDIAGAAGTARLVPMAAAAVLQMPGDCGGVRKRIEEPNADVPVRGNADWEEREKNNQDARFFGAMRVHDIASSYVYCWGLHARTMWQQTGHDPEYMNHYDSNGIPRYSILTVCEPITSGGLPDEARPCIVGYQSDVTPLEDGRLLVSELNAFLVLATRYGGRRAYADCDELVITVITGSDRLVRIAQSRVNFVNNTFDVSLSRILDFETTIEKNFDDFITLVGWFACSIAPRTSWA